jgi:hypothetical protein
MVHTIEIGHGMGRDKLEQFARCQSVFDDQQLSGLLSGQVSQVEAAEYQLPGFNKFRLYRRGNEQYYFLCIVINPQVLLTNRPTIDLFSCTQDNVEALTVPFWDGVRVLAGVNFSPLLEWSVVRIDYALNLHTPHVAEYVALAKRAKVPRDFSCSMDKPGSFYIHSKSVTLNFYDKLDEMQKKPNWGQYYDRLCSDAADIYRIEVQCKGSKRFDIMQAYHLPDISVAGFLDERIAQDTIQEYYRSTIGYGDYYSRPALYQRILETSWRKPKKERIHNWLRLIAQTGSFAESSDCFLQGVYLNDEPQTWVQGSKRTLADYIENCKHEGINMITIPESYGIDYLPNPMPKDWR